MPQARRDVIAAEVVRLLKKERERKGLSMTQLAAKSGLSLSIISFLERGLRNPTLDTLLRVAEALKLNLSSAIRKAEAKANSEGKRI